MAFEQLDGSFDFNFLPPNFHGDIQAFMTANNGQGMQKWTKPRGISMCCMIAIAGGGGGGAGLTGASTTARGGGGGGASSGLSMLLCPAIFLPDNLSIQVGNGGLGGVNSGSAGTSGKNTYIGYGAGLTAITAIPNLILSSGANAPGGGAAGALTGNAAGGTVPSVISDATIGHSAYLGFTRYLVGLVGATGGLATVGAAGTSVGSAWNATPFSPGGGGASVSLVSTGLLGGSVSLQAALDFADGSFAGPTNYIAGGNGGGISAAGNGNSGVNSFKPFLFTGGSGGGSSDGFIGGAGGNGGIGSGGGGGGGGITGGSGGNGGDGMAIIISW